MKIHTLVYSDPLKIGSSLGKSITLITEAARHRGHVLEVINAKDCRLKLGKKPGLFVDGHAIDDVRVVLVKAGFSAQHMHEHVSLIRQFELLGLPTLNSAAAVSSVKDKILMLQTLNEQKIPIPKTYVVRSAQKLSDFVNDIGSYPVILKSFSGAAGIGVSIVESQRGLRSIIDLLVRLEETGTVILQQYLKESRGKDIRVVVVGGKIVAAMERIATKKGEFRSNFSLGGRVRVAELSEQEKRLAKKATSVFGLDFAGVDIMRSKEGPKVLEVNANPGLDGITQATGVDVAGKLIDLAVARVAGSLVDRVIKRGR